MPEPRVIYEGSTEPFSMTVSAVDELGDQDVDFSFDGGTTWKTAAWAGSTTAKVRQATLTVSIANLPAFPFDVVALCRVDGTIKPGLGRRVVGREIPA